MVKHLHYKLRIIFIACILCMHSFFVSAVVKLPSLLIQNFSNQEYKASCQNWKITVGREGFLFIANNSGLLVFDGNSWTNYETPDQSVVKSVVLHQDTIFTGHGNDFGYWVADENGSYLYHSLLKSFPSVKIRNEVFDKLYSVGNTLWAKSENHCFRYENGEVAVFHLPERTTDAELLQDGSTLYLSVIGRGLYEVKENGLFYLPAFDCLADKKIIFIHSVGKENYLVGTENEGIFLVTGNACLPWNTPVNEELKHSRVSSLEIVGDVYLIGTYYNGLYITSPQGVVYEHYTVANRLQDMNVHDICKQDDKSVWLAFDNGISLLTFSSPITLLAERIKVGKLLDGTWEDGSIVIRTNQGVFKQTVRPDGRSEMLPYDGELLFTQETKIRDILASLSPEIADTVLPFRNVLLENDYILWGVQNDNKIYRLRLSDLSNEQEAVKNYTLPVSLQKEAISDLALIDGVVVLFTGASCWRYDEVEDVFVRYDELEGLLGEYVTGKIVFPVGVDLYWIVSGNEMALFYIKEGTGQLKCRILLDNYNLNIVNRDKQIIPLSDSLHLVSAMQGVLLVNTRELIESHFNIKAPFNVRRIQYTDRKGTIHSISAGSGKIKLPYDFQDLKVNVGTSIFTASHQVSYKMSGTSSWSEWQKNGEISFFQLPVGKYELEVRKYVVKGIFPSISLQIEVGPPWYDTIWAYIVYLLLLWGVVQGGLRYYLKYQRKQEQAVLEAERVTEQQRLQQLKNEILETELQNKNNELTLQTTALVKRNQVMQSLLEELDNQKQTLGERYPNKLYNRMKSLIEENISNQADWILFESYFNSAHQNFMDRLRAQYPDLTTGDFRICCLLRMNLSTKEIASLLNVSVRSVELRRYRLRKRLALSGEANLVEFLTSF